MIQSVEGMKFEIVNTGNIFSRNFVAKESVSEK